MYLKTLTVRGFKSFASATTFEFEPGVTAVVGPNGSGKSNVVDALAWVMGEQGAKTLRGGKMEDVIFAGTTGRAALGRAQVSLTIDNSDGALPIEYSEVTITRTLFRSGGSEYAINGSPARLLDIQELLSDSGLGREMHVIVGQGQLDRILRATPEERRGFIEEAAGILKHRRRKEKTLRKLDSMQANLARLEDLTGEIAKQLRPLGKQAATARRAKTVQATVRDAKARILADDLSSLKEVETNAQVERGSLEAQRVQAQAEAERLDRDLARFESRAADLTPVTVKARDAWYSLSRLQERYQAIVSLGLERRRLLGAATSDESHGDSPEDLEKRSSVVREDAARVTKEISQLTETLEQIKQSRVNLENEQQTEEEKLTTALRAIADRREGLARLAGDVGAARQRLESAQGERHRAEKTCVDARKRLAQAETDLMSAQERLETATARSKAPSATVVELKKELEARQVEQRAARSEVSPLAEVRAGLESRVRTLGESFPLATGSDQLLEGLDSHILGQLAEKLRVEPGMEYAVSAGLLGAESALVTAGQAALSHVAHASAGGTQGTLWLLDAETAKVTNPAYDLPNEVHWLRDYVGCEERYRGLVDALLSNVVLAKDDTQARAISSSSGLVAVTSLGHRWTSTGLRIGNGDAASLQRKAKLEAAAAELEAARLAETKAREVTAEIEPKVRKLQQDLSAAEAHARAASDEVRKSAAEVNRLESLTRQANGESERAELALSKAKQAVAAANEALTDLAARLEQAKAAPVEKEPSTEVRDRLARLVEAKRTEEMQARLDVSATEAKRRQLEERAESLLRASQREREARRQAELRAHRRAQRAAAAERVANLGKAVQDRLAKDIEVAQSSLEALESEQRQLGAAVEALRRSAGRAKAEANRLTEITHSQEVMATERAAQISHLETRILEDIGMTPDYLLEHYGPHLSVPIEDDPSDQWAALHVEVDEAGNPVEGSPYNRREQELRLKRAEKDLASLGKINPLALEEFAALEERHTYLSGQLEDLKASQKDLMDLVLQVDEHVRDVFASAFNDTAAEFKRIFARLFPGGEGQLVLTEPEDMLTTGIEVHARPAGKKVKRLSLLSGGERSLTAIAMLVAIFSARPSPFYVMDEVEAALDERNLMRLLTVFSDLRQRSQLIVITHQKRTMETADAIYGISMRGDGVSQVISQRLHSQTRV